jgi:curved DNA-binding protein CbpA
MRSTDRWIENLSRLELPRTARWEAIQAKYRKLVLSFHPDINPSRSASERFRQIVAAHEELLELHRQQQAQSAACWAKMHDDPKIRSLSLQEIATRLQYSSSPRVRAVAAYLLGQLGGKESRWILLRAKGDPDDDVRRMVLASLGSVGKPSDLVRFLPALFGPKRLCLGVFLRLGAQIGLRTLRGVPPVGRLKQQVEGEERSSMENRKGRGA